MKYLDETMGIIMRGMEIIGTAIGDPPNPEKVEPKSENPSTFEQSLVVQQDNTSKAVRR